jgi:hypothetical protein
MPCASFDITFTDHLVGTLPHFIEERHTRLCYRAGDSNTEIDN